MKSKFVPTRIVRGISTQKLLLQKNTPHILFGVGIVGVIGGTVLACRATLKSGPVLDEFKEDIEAVKRDLSDTDHYQKDLAYAYIRGTTELVKLYAPAIVVTGVSVAALTGSHVQMTRRNTSLTIAYAGLHKAYEEYRERVRKELGKDKELDIYHGVEVEKEKDGAKVIDKRIVDPNKLSVYARLFDSMSSNWTNEPEYNLVFLKAQQNYLNNLLHVRGHVFLNEVYDALDIPRSRAGQIVGWVIGADGDNYIDFGLYEKESSRFVNGIENAILLDFNVDGVIYDKIG